MSAFARLAIITLNTCPMNTHARQGKDFAGTHSETDESTEASRPQPAEKTSVSDRIFARARIALASWL